MQIKAVNAVGVAVVVCLLAVAVFWTWTWSGESAVSAGHPPTVVTAATAEAAPRELAARREVAVPTPTVADPTESLETFQGRVFDSSGSPLAGVPVRTVPTGSDLGVTSGVDGVFELPISDRALEIRARGAAWATLIAGQVAVGGPVGSLQPIVVVGPAIKLGGQVVDNLGRPVASATVRVALPANFAARFLVSLDATRSAYRDWRVETDASGRFVLPEVAAIPGASLTARARDHLPGRVDTPNESRSDLRLVVERPAASGASVLGQVIDPHGQGVADARVGMGRRSTTSGPDGRFRLAFGDQAPTGSTPITALVHGYLPARSEAEVPTPGNPPPFVFLHLGSEPLSIEGRVLDRDGKPVPGVRVWARDSEVAEGLGGSVEGYLAGGATRKALRARLARAPHLAEDADELGTIQPSADWGWVRTAQDGRFKLGGLLERSYQLGMMRDQLLQFSAAGPYVAGSTGVELRFTPETYVEVGGRVVGQDGRPVAGVTVDVTAWSDLGTKRRARDGKVSQNLEAVRGPRCKTDAQGRFRVTALGKQPFFVTVIGEQIMNRNFGLEERGMQNVSPTRPMDDLLLVVKRRFHLRIDLGADVANRFRVVDGNDKPLPIVLFDGGGRNSSGSRPIVAGRSRVYAVGEGGVAVVLLADEVEVRRLPIFLKAGEVNVVGR